MNHLVLSCCVCVLTASPVLLAGEQSRTAFPISPGKDGRHLVDGKGRPFLYNADTAWMILLKLTEQEAGEYLDVRRQQRFNTIQIMLTGVPGMANRAGRRPFGEHNDFARPDEDYFAHAERVLTLAESKGLLVAAAPLWVSCCRDGWGGEDKNGRPGAMRVNGPEQCRAFGQYLGTRFGRFKNLMWILGGDNDPHGDREHIRELVLGLKAAAPRQMLTYHAASSHSSTDVWPEDAWLDVVMVYTYFRGFDKAWNKQQPDVYEVSWAEYDKKPVRPFFLGESTYEGEHGEWGSALQARKQAYWCVLGGGTGNAYGSPNWNMPANWREVLKLPGAASLSHFYDLFTSRKWHLLIPDRKREVLVAGQGEFARNDLATAALASDRSFAVAYLPGRRTVGVDLDRLAGERVKAWWYNPRDGRATLIGEMESRGRHDFTPPTDGDWVLVMDDAAGRVVAPGENGE